MMFWVSTIRRRLGPGRSYSFTSTPTSLLLWCRFAFTKCFLQATMCFPLVNSSAKEQLAVPFNLLLVISLFLKTRNNIRVSGRVAMMLHRTKTASLWSQSLIPLCSLSPPDVCWVYTLCISHSCTHKASTNASEFSTIAPHPFLNPPLPYLGNCSWPQNCSLSLCCVVLLSGVKDSTNSTKV